MERNETNRNKGSLYLRPTLKSWRVLEYQRRTSIFECSLTLASPCSTEYYGSKPSSVACSEPLQSELLMLSFVVDVNWSRTSTARPYAPGDRGSTAESQLSQAVSGGGERKKEGHVLKDTTSRGLCVRIRPPHTIGRRGEGEVLSKEVVCLSL